MKRIQAVFAGVAAAFLSLSAQAAVMDRVVAVVNEEVITQSELNSALEPYLSRLNSFVGLERDKAFAETRLGLLNRMIDELLMAQQAKKNGVNVSDDDINATIKDLLSKKNMSLADLLKALDKEGVSLEGYKKSLKDQILRIKVIQQEVKTRASVSDDEIAEYYRRHREDYEGTESVRVRQIFLPLPKEEEPALKGKVRMQMVEIHKRLLSGQPFEALAAQFSQGPAAESGGDIGFIEKGMILAEVEEVALRLPVNKISDVIESSVGFHVIQVTDRRGAGLKSIESVRNEIREKIEQEKMDKKVQEWIETLRTKSHIEIRL
ncbi:MAG: peptidylprolyl isomerase [Deltaproteobacteria bacterium]|nr:peptidylprolyl isomerase [Deltaproteobacteria bacterium]